ncbi:P-loop containing nucleoside triphosphate hydrolase protein [Nemania sp. NC0429]|nr:P-loop containing nucleoside triphosphate hydrolase protein [Nemania sp. NC0429]
MYSRYVPTPNGGSIPPELESVATPLQAQIPPKPPPTTYARYVPPPPKSAHSTPSHVLLAQHVRFDDEDGASQEEPPTKRVKLRQDEATTPAPDQEPLQKSKKKKRKPLQQPEDLGDDEAPINSSVVEEGEVPAEDHGDATERSEDIEVHHTPDDLLSQSQESVPAIEEDLAEESTRKKDKRKQKKPKHDRGLNKEAEDDVPHRHKAILNKKAKSLQRADLGPGDVTAFGAASTADNNASQQKTPEIELHGLEPIPQPQPVALDTSTPLYETLPPWLAAPVLISQDASASFTDFGLTPELGITAAVAERLAAKGYKQAFAIQTGVIPLLLPSHGKEMQGDVLVSAATGSGKTLAYSLPMIRDISQSSRHTTRLRALIIVPTRELVRQVQQVCEDCAGIFALDGVKRRPRIGMAMGSQPFEHEQASFIEKVERYDPGAYQQRVKRLARLNGQGHESDDDGDSGYNTEDEEKDAIRRREDKIQTLPDHIIAYKSKVDILICTPGRLVEHIKFTPGFSLDFVRWLIVDEADKLLGQNFQQWLGAVIPRLQAQDKRGARNHKQSNLSGVRKVILSATMTRDLDQLEGLKLRRPTLVVLEGSKVQDEARDSANRTEHVLPGLLEEAALKISDPNLKPLFLIDLLRSNYILGSNGDADRHTSDDDETSSSGSDSETDSDVDLDTQSAARRIHAAPSKILPQAHGMASVLIFTKSNETTLRLSRLLALLAPSLERFIGTLTSTTPYTTRRDTLRSFNAGRLAIVVASDLVARGIDLPSLDHVINYDMPSSIASYVHRVGRTARAGNTGKAWTLVTNPEARWFWNEIASEKVIQRSRHVERVRVTEEKEEAFDDKVAAYEAALENLGQEAGQAHHRS